jgi:predicted lipase
MDNNKAYEMALLSERAYLPLDEFSKQHTDRRFSYHSVGGTQFYTVWTSTELIFAFRGTEVTDFADIKSDIKMKRVPTGTDHESGSVHRGFKAALDLVWDTLLEDYNRLCEGRHVIFTGHSLGAALATLAMSRLDNYDAELYTFGSPRVGNSDFKAVFNFKFDSVYRFRNQNDIVTRHPLALWDYRHVGTCYYFDGDGTCSSDPSLWHRIKQFALGMYAGIESHKVDSFADHSVSNYVRLTKGLL